MLHSDTVAVKKMNGNDGNQMLGVLIFCHTVCMEYRAGIGATVSKLVMVNGRSDTVAVKHALGLSLEWFHSPVYGTVTGLQMFHS